MNWITGKRQRRGPGPDYGWIIGVVMANAGNKFFSLPSALKNHDRALSMKTCVVYCVMAEQQGTESVVGSTGKIEDKEIRETMTPFPLAW